MKSGSGRRERLADAVEALCVERGTADKRAVNVGFGKEQSRIFGRDAAAVKNRCELARSRSRLHEARADAGMHGLSRCRISRPARADGPDGFIGNCADAFGFQNSEDGIELTENDGGRLSALAFLKRFAPRR